ncbi:hypothetical protein [Legionella sp. km772]|uniref:hypothetical protein n=1 Tax=Legionella sp. km772 TaxID=2498111 RepID=UPI000F8E3721|nr:hypothetical protein [Legionella sp. km772]RUR11640.1 hypothetical protein ELY15_06860 [Legionella sp. km772]
MQWIKNRHLELQFAWLNLKPMSNNYTYAYAVSGTQPYFQNWAAQAFNPSYSSAYELGLSFNYRKTR